MYIYILTSISNYVYTLITLYIYISCIYVRVFHATQYCNPILGKTSSWSPECIGFIRQVGPVICRQKQKLLMVQKSGDHQLIYWYFIPLFTTGFWIHPRWLFRISEPSTVVLQDVGVSDSKLILAGCWTTRLTYTQAYHVDNTASNRDHVSCESASTPIHSTRKAFHVS